MRSSKGEIREKRSLFLLFGGLPIDEVSEDIRGVVLGRVEALIVLVRLVPDASRVSDLNDAHHTHTSLHLPSSVYSTGIL